MKITHEVLIDYVDGTLDAARTLQVENYLASHAEDAALVADIKAATGFLQPIAAEPVVASEEFWPRLRDKLPAAPRRHPIRRAALSVGRWLWPSHSPLRLSSRVAAIVALVVVGASLFMPREATHTALATDEQTFIREAMNRHSAYVSSQPVAALPQTTGDLRNSDGDDAGEEGSDIAYEP